MISKEEILSFAPTFGLLPTTVEKDYALTVTNTSSAMSQLMAAWPAYQKPVDARTLGRQYSLDDLKRVAAHDAGLQNLLSQIGLLRS